MLQGTLRVQQVCQIFPAKQLLFPLKTYQLQVCLHPIPWFWKLQGEGKPRDLQKEQLHSYSCQLPCQGKAKDHESTSRFEVWCQKLPENRAPRHGLRNHCWKKKATTDRVASFCPVSLP